MITGLKKGRILGIGLLVFLIVVAGAWRWTSVAEWVQIRTLSVWIGFLQNHPAGPLAVVGAYLVGSLVLFPITILIAVTVFIYGPILGFTYALLGSILAAALTYGIGYLLGQEIIRQIAGAHMGRVQHAAATRGMAVALVTHMVPVAPFTVVNLISGASRIRFHDFAFGTFFGMVPGITAITLFEHHFENAIRNPGIEAFLALAFVLTVSVAAMAWIRRYFRDSPGARIVPEEEKRG